MIGTPLPGTLPYLILAELAAIPGELDTAELAEILLPHNDRFSPGMDYPEWAKSRREHRARSRRHISRTLSRLTEAGYVEPCGDVRLAPWARERADDRVLLGGSPAEMLSAVLDRGLVDGLGSSDGWEDGDPDDELEVVTGPGAHREAFVIDLYKCGGMPYRDLMGRRPSGAMKRAYSWLVEVGVVEAPSCRRCTRKGLRLVGSP